MTKKKKISLTEQFKKKSDNTKYQHITQKLTHHFQKFTEDYNTRIRWIWELIQNAKDAPNQFNKVKIKIAIYDDKLTFSHNDDPFRVTDLQSIISQISSKSNPNNIQGIQEQTTGKYGTGFITTYILSKKLKLEGLIQVKQYFQCNSDQSSSQSQQDSCSQRHDQKQQQNLTKKSQLKKDKLIAKQKQKTETNKIAFQKQQQQEDTWYQKFKVNLDRNFQDIDYQDLTKKLFKQEKKFFEKLNEQKDRKKKWQRTQNDFDTIFTYHKLDKSAFEIIELGIESVRNLFGYSLLFNEKLYSIQVTDKRKNPEIVNFKIQKQEKLPINHILFFKYKFIQENKAKEMQIQNQEENQDNLNFLLSQNQKKVEKQQSYQEELQKKSQKNKFSLKNCRQQYRYLAFQQSNQEIVCIPIQLHEQQDHQFFEILQIPPNTPKVFKQFPLIGCQDTNFNFVFTSKVFQPNETRSQLLLKTIQGRQQTKVDKNYEELKQVFQSAQKLYTYLLPNTKYGIKNYFQFSLTNYFTQQDSTFQQCLEKYIENILDLKTIEMRNGKKCKGTDLYFLYQIIFKIIKKVYLSCQMNNLFYFLYGSQCTLSEESYMELFQIFSEKKQILQQYIKYIEPLDCLKLISQNLKNFKNFEYKLQSQNLQNSKGLKKMKDIFKYLSKYTQYLNLKVSPILNFNVFLTNNNQLTYFQQNLEIKNNLPLVFQEIANILDINYENQLLHDELIQYVTNSDYSNYFSSQDMIQLFKMYFGCESFSQFNFKKFVELGCFLQSFNSYKNQMLPKIVQNMRLLKEIKKYDLNDKLPQLQDSYQIAFENKFIQNLLYFVGQKVEQNQQVDIFCKKHLTNTMDFYEWYNQILKLEKKINKKTIKLSIINQSLFIIFFKKVEIKQKILLFLYKQIESISFYCQKNVFFQKKQYQVVKNQKNQQNLGKKKKFSKFYLLISSFLYQLRRIFNSNNNLFKKIENLLFIPKNTQYPTISDQKIYRQIVNPEKHLPQLLLHKKILSTFNLRAYNFKDHFQKLNQIFNKTSNDIKIKILKFSNEVNESYQRQNNQNTKLKYQTLKNIIQQRHERMINITYLNDKQKGTIFHLLDCKDDLDNVTKLRQLNSLQNIYQRQEQNAKIQKLINKKMIKK